MCSSSAFARSRSLPKRVVAVRFPFVTLAVCLRRPVYPRSGPIEPPAPLPVLTDVIRSLLTPIFLVDMFRPQAPTPPRELRGVFERLAHSSIMRLNSSSMGKLFDLMSMGVKFQVLGSGHPSRVPLHVTTAHLAHIKDILCASGVAGAAAHRSSSPTLPAPAGDTAAEPTAEAALQGAVREAQQLGASDGGGAPRREGTILDLLDAVQRTMTAVYAHLPPGELWALHFTLLRFFQDRRVRVSVYLAEGLQQSDGAFLLPLRGPLPAGVAPPGALQRFGADGKPAGPPEPLHALHALQASGGGECWGSTEDWRALGRNMYEGDLARDAGGVGGSPQAAASHPPGGAEQTARATGATAAAAATAGLNAFSRMLGGAGGGEEEAFELFLAFGEGEGDVGGGGAAAAPPELGAAASPAAVQRVNGALGVRSGRRLGDALRGELDEPLAGAGGGGGKEGEGNDLLSLLDSLGT
jgi:hypothetical protein